MSYTVTVIHRKGDFSYEEAGTVRRLKQDNSCLI